MSIAFCTMAIHSPYRRRARLLCADAPQVPWYVLTDEPSEFSDLGVTTIAHTPTGPMAIDYLEEMKRGSGWGTHAYHDKRFALQRALADHTTAIFVDADSRLDAVPALDQFPGGLSVLPVIERSTVEHLALWGGWRLAAFTELAALLTGDSAALTTARWCFEACMAVPKDGREPAFFAAWGKAAEFMQARRVFSGEGGVIGLAAACAGWNVDFNAVSAVGAHLRHEGGGPKAA